MLLPPSPFFFHYALLTGIVWISLKSLSLEVPAKVADHFTKSVYMYSCFCLLHFFDNGQSRL